MSGYGLAASYLDDSNHQYDPVEDLADVASEVFGKEIGGKVGLAIRQKRDIVSDLLNMPGNAGDKLIAHLKEVMEQIGISNNARGIRSLRNHAGFISERFLH